ncbi:MAG: translation initiation factor IF-3 [Candidatus Firestonebacteria bacterium]|nr:translation initiation factor IF-3 [Candidatus Firestonebacteria bacterium]
MTISKQYRINNYIRVNEVRLIGVNGDQLGVVPTATAVSMAKTAKLDLIEISPNSVPPVCKIADFGKFRYDIEKKEKLARKNQKIVVIKEIKIRPKIDTHDFNTKTGHIDRFLKEGNKVRVTIMFRGREMAHKEIGKALLDKVIAQFTPIADVEQPSKLEGYNMTTLLAPKKGK